MAASGLDWLFFTALALGSIAGVGSLFGADAPDAEVSDAIEADTDADVSDAVEADTDGAGEAPVASGWSVLGVGHVPLGLLLSLDALLFGGLGVVASEILRAVLPSAVMLSLPFAFFSAPLLGARLARAIARRVPATESHGATRASLIGQPVRLEIAGDQLDHVSQDRARDRNHLQARPNRRAVPEDRKYLRRPGTPQDR